MRNSFSSYVSRVHKVGLALDEAQVKRLEDEISIRLKNKKKIFLCGNGGSAANAIHMENDYLYGVKKSKGQGANVYALSANSSVITCLANDIGYEEIFAEQLRVKGGEGDLLIVFSGSGNSPNILNALDASADLKITSAAILGFDGGIAKDKAEIVIHADVDDMQVAEDLQCMVLHHIMQNIYQSTNPKE